MKTLVAIYMLGLVAAVGIILWRTAPEPAPPPSGAVAARALPANHLVGPGDVKTEQVVGYTKRAVRAGEALSNDVLSRAPALQAMPTEVLALLTADPATVRRNAGSAAKICQGATVLAVVDVQAVICDGANTCRAAASLPATTAAKLGTAYALKAANETCAPPMTPKVTVSTN